MAGGAKPVKTEDPPLKRQQTEDERKAFEERRKKIEALMGGHNGVKRAETSVP